MIVKMKKVYVAVRGGERSRLLDALRDAGVVHLKPVDPERAQPEERTVSAIQRLARADQVLSSIEAEGPAPDLAPLDAADRVLELYARASEIRNRMASLAREVDHLDIWGDARLETFQALRDAGVYVRFCRVPAEDVSKVPGACVQVVGEQGDMQVVAAVTESDEPWELPESAEPMPLPDRDRPTLRAEARKLQEQLEEDREELGRLAQLRAWIVGERKQQESQASYTVADRGGLEGEELFAVQGWAPAEEADDLAMVLKAKGLIAAIELVDVEEDEVPPTLVRYPAWARPMKAMFGILGTTPGYREYDLSPFFMIALPLFAAMLIGDAGYGLIFTLISVLGFGRIRAKAGVDASRLLVVFSLFMLGWGMVTANYFGVSPIDMNNAGGFWASLGGIAERIGFLWNPNPDVARNTIIKISFVFGTIHLVLAHLRQVIGMFPHPKALAELGWSGFLLGMLGVVWMLFFPAETWMPQRVMLGLLGVGFVLVVLFSVPVRNPLKRLGLGILTNLLPSISTFSDTMSYIRLMAVGLASYYIASAFNGLGYSIGSGGGLLILPAALIIIFAHALNIVLGIIAIFAHGVRLNMLEFSSNAGVQWEGYPYSPFSNETAA